LDRLECTALRRGCNEGTKKPPKHSAAVGVAPVLGMLSIIVGDPSNARGTRTAWRAASASRLHLMNHRPHGGAIAENAPRRKADLVPRRITVAIPAHCRA